MDASVSHERVQHGPVRYRFFRGPESVLCFVYRETSDVSLELRILVVLPWYFMFKISLVFLAQSDRPLLQHGANIKSTRDTSKFTGSVSTFVPFIPNIPFVRLYGLYRLYQYTFIPFYRIDRWKITGLPIGYLLITYWVLISTIDYYWLPIEYLLSTY